MPAAKFTFMKNLPYIKNATKIVRIKNKAPNTTVALLRTASKPRAFCLPINCSAPPEIAPDKPALRPDCKTTTIINKIDTIINKIFTNAANIHTSNETIKPF